MTDSLTKAFVTSLDAHRFELGTQTARKAVVIETDRFCQQVTLVNVTSMGFLARSRFHYVPGERLTVHLDTDDTVEAHAAWWADGLLGARFVDKLAHDISTELLHVVTARPSRAGFAEAA